MNLALLVLRLVVGALFVGHGAQKLFGWFGGHGPDGTGKFFESIGMTRGRAMAILAGACELIGGLLLVFGLMTPVGAALLTAVMIVAIWTVHGPNGLWVTQNGYEYNLVLLTVLFAVAAAGADDWSLDGLWGLDLAGAGWALAQSGGRHPRCRTRPWRAAPLRASSARPGPGRTGQRLVGRDSGLPCMARRRPLVERASRCCGFDRLVDVLSPDRPGVEGDGKVPGYRVEARHTADLARRAAELRSRTRRASAKRSGAGIEPTDRRAATTCRF